MTYDYPDPRHSVYTDTDRSPEALAFLQAVAELGRYHGFEIEHQDSGGSFEIRRVEGAANEWLLDADEVVPTGTEG